MIKQNLSPLLGVVVIGRNEGERLGACLESMQAANLPIAYVDSGSSDKSLSIAQGLASIVHALDTTKPFSAARARNKGFDLLTNQYPSLQFVQFVDGDCTIIVGWFETAVVALQADEKRAAVIGHLIERNADASVYNRLCALEWKSPPGDLRNFGALGGISVVRASVFKQLKGFRADVIAGEDSELGVRMSLLGYRITKLDYNMATHDANMTNFGQWWKRAVRAGHAIGQRAYLNGNSPMRDCAQERKSTFFWGIFIPVLVLILLIPSGGFSLLLLLGYMSLAYKVYRYRLKTGDSKQDARIYTKFILLGKFANGLGLIKFYINNMRKQYSIIEYK